MHERSGGAERPGTRAASDHADVRDSRAAERGLDHPLVVALILDDARHHQPPTGSARDFDRLGSALVGMDASEEQ